jgi:hypothetical protein
MGRGLVKRSTEDENTYDSNTGRGVRIVQLDCDPGVPAEDIEK